MRTRKAKGGATVLIMTVVISGALTSILGARQVQRISTEPQWVASADMQAGQVITYQELQEVRGKKDDRAVKSPAQLVGKLLAEDKPEGAPFYSSDIKSPPRSWLAQKVPEGRVLYTLVPHNNTIPHTLLRNGDRFDVLVTGRRGVRTVAQEVQLIGALADKNSKASDDESGRTLITRLTSRSNDSDKEASSSNAPLIIAIRPGEVYPLASIRSDETVSLVLHGEAEVNGGALLNINPMTALQHQIEVFSGLDRRSVYINN